MKKLKQTNWLLTILFSLFLFSCSQNNEIGNSNIQSSKYFVKLSEAKTIADNLSFPVNDKTLKAKGINYTSKNVKNINEIKNENGVNSFYVINFEEGGYIILSADKRIPPILGYSDTNTFNINESQYPDGLKFWMNDTKKQVTDIQNSNIEQSENEKKVWESIQVNGLSYRVPPESCYEHTDIYTKGPLLSSLWYQSDGFNSALPTITCNGFTFQVYAGCVPIAMAQVMKYYQYPTNYNWSSMPLTYATSTTANFIKDIWDAIGAVYGSSQPSYDCDVTGVSTSNDMSTVLKTQFNYTSANSTAYDRDVVKNNIEANRPIILSGNDGLYTIGHMWVCDGYRITTYYFADCTGVGYFHFHMNWGWGTGYNGWYTADVYNSINIPHYNQNKEIIYNIIP
ncbi:MAG: C10 family peptidase [Lutibacter sp.]|uniref:C10 family peptidase n=1 Tax=Lutibacter sp. TaxID=1925666 RepID=UPI00299EE846|nr:C10 family peptidase [Lutibacter sp.]MDX1830499.1 C10 family peptidase [Lutibacter sp.]